MFCANIVVLFHGKEGTAAAGGAFLGGWMLKAFIYSHRIAFLDPDC